LNNKIIPIDHGAYYMNSISFSIKDRFPMNVHRNFDHLDYISMNKLKRTVRLDASFAKY